MSLETVEKRADFYAQDQSGSTLEIHCEHEIKSESKAVTFLIEIRLSDATSSRRQTIRVNPMEFVSLAWMLQDKIDRAHLEILGEKLTESPNGFGHILDEPLNAPVGGSTAESMLLGELAAAELAERKAQAVELTPKAANHLAEKLVHLFGAEEALTVAGGGGSAIGDDDAALLEGEVA